MDWTLSFAEVGTPDIPLVGGKAANLGEMVRAGLPVPPGFCVTAEAYREFVRVAGLAERIERLLADLDPDSTSQVDEAARRIRGLFNEEPIPSEIAESISQSYAELALVVDGGGQPAVAVRSSATAEDLPDASFAGQQDTYLHIRGTDALLEHVRRCWASLWTARAVTYRANHGYDHDKVALAVAVQAMVEADVAGVMFTADPVTNDRASLVINASWGLGEAIVSGIVTPDTWRLSKADRRIVDRLLGHKDRMVVRLVDGGTQELDVEATLRDVPSLSDAAIAELAGIGLRVEDHYGRPMDIEWAYADGKPYMLQARPITTLAEATTDRPAPLEPGDYNRSMFIEIFPDPLSPAFLSVIEPLFVGMLDFTFRTLGFSPPKAVRGVVPMHAQPYFNQRYIEAALAPLRPPTRKAFVAQIVNPFGRHDRGAPFELSLPFLRMSWRLLRLMRSLHEVLPREVTRYQREIAALEKLDLAELSEAELVGQVEKLVFSTANRLLNYDFLLIALVGVTYQALGSLLEPYFDAEAQDVRARLVSGVTGNVTMETNKQLWDLAQSARASRAVVNELGGNLGGNLGDVAEVRRRLAATRDGQAFLVKLDAFLTVYGHREVRMDIMYPTWIEDPAPVLRFVRGYLAADEALSPHRQQERLVHEREELARQVRTRVRHGLRGRLLVWPIFNWVLRHTQANTRQRDTMHFELTRLFPPFRRLLLELGQRWAARGVVGRADDVFYLTLDEMRGAADSSAPLAERIAGRRRQLENDRRVPPPPIVRDGVEIWPEADAATGEATGELRGIAGSPGRSTGRVRLVRGPDEFDRLVSGEILVAPLTNPVWTPLFAVAGGLITEVGGILSHGAIVAREYGIPAVMAVSGAMTKLSDGQQVTVDGSRGVVLVEAPP
jgi:phosphohistidine swiveling domain-containing protein